MLAVTENKQQILAATAAAAAATCCYAVYKKFAGDGKKWRRVGKVDRLCLFPLKGGAAIHVTGAATFQSMGMRAGPFRDREFCVVRAHNNQFVGGDKYPKLRLLRLEVVQGRLQLTAPDRESVVIPEDQLRYDPDRELEIPMFDVKVKTVIIRSVALDQMLTEFLGDPLRLAFHWSSDAQRSFLTKYAKLYPETHCESDITALSHSTAYTLLAWPSVHWLNQQIEREVDPLWFRSNIIIATDDEETPFQEDKWTGKMRFGDKATLHFNRPNTRCPNIAVDPVTGTAREDKEPLKTLRKLRAIDPNASAEDARRRKVLGDAPMFAANFSLETTGDVSVGDIVYVEEA